MKKLTIVSMCMISIGLLFTAYEVESGTAAVVAGDAAKGKALSNNPKFAGAGITNAKIQLSDCFFLAASLFKAFT